VIQQIIKNFNDARQILDEFISNEKNWVSFEKAGDILVEAIRKKHIIFSCGNGGSMCDAMHFAEELSGRFRNDRPSLPAIAIGDASHITCAANDYGFDSVFSRYLEGIGKHGDVLLAISTSGNSKNIINAAQTAKKTGMKVVALTGKDGGKLALLADAELRAPFSEFSDRVQEIHIKIIHSLIHYIELNLA
jgi:D-sedoheptulose 7-phosphate isomerase